MGTTFTDYAGQKMGMVTIIERAGRNKRKRVLWRCKCDCGKEFITCAESLARGRVSCGCAKTRVKKDVTGQRFGRLVAVRLVDKTEKGYMWECKCDCGNTCIVTGRALRKGDTKSCGCLKLDMFIDLNKTHGLSKTPLYRRWASIKGRCNNKNNKRYHDYGGRGIKLCDEWRNYETFYAWAIKNGYKRNLTIDRIDNNGNYCPENCRWVTPLKNAYNKRNTITISYRGETLSLLEWSIRTNIPKHILYTRKRCGWDAERILTTPPMTRTRKERTPT